MPTQNAELITQLNALLRLTAHEAATARARVAQASTDETRKELTENARNCDRRSDAIRRAVRDLGGAPDVLGVALGRAAAAAKLPLEQSMPLTEALLADLALEHQLFDRARLVKVLAHDADAPDLVALAERLEDAHGSTIQWLFTVLSETALGGPAALTPTGLQTAVAAARNAATLATTKATAGLNRAVATAGSLGENATATVTSRAERLAALTRSARQVVTAGRNASLAEAEKQAGKELGKGAAGTVHTVRANLGAVAAADLPIRRYDDLTAKEAADAVGRLRAPEDVRVVLAYEQAHKDRKAVVDEATKRTAELAEELVNS